MLESSLGCSLQTKAPFLHSIAQVYTGTCQPFLQRASTIRDLKIATAPLRQFALDHGIERLSLSLRLPDLEITETQPASSTQSLLVGRMPASFQHFSELMHQYFWQIGSDIPEHVTVRFGISANSVKRAEYVLLGVLLFPALLVFWMGRKALSSEAQDKAVVWFACTRYLNWTLNLSLLGWWIAADSLHLLKLLQFFSAGTRFAPVWAYAVTPTIVKWLPPEIIWVVCLVLSHPVQENLRGLTWTRRELAMQGASILSALPFNELFLTTIFATVGAILCGRPFHLLPFFFSRMIPAVAKVTPFHGPGSGWYVVGVVQVVRFLAIIPALRYKDQAVVTLAPSHPQTQQLSAAPSAPSQPRKVENDKVFTH